MNKNFVLLASAGAAIALSACARAPRPTPISPECAAASDSLSKYVSIDALPFAHLIGTPRVLPVPPSLRRGDSIAVEFVVRPDGLADPSSIEILGSNDQGFARQVLRFATESRFIPERVMGCNVLSKYNLVIKPTG